MVKFNAGILSPPCFNSNNFPRLFINEYSKFNKLCKSVVSNPNFWLQSDILNQLKLH